jgi:Concanavalin A-like lectin/glucanases superfamily
VRRLTIQTAALSAVMLSGCSLVFSLDGYEGDDGGDGHVSSEASRPDAADARARDGTMRDGAKQDSAHREDSHGSLDGSDVDVRPKDAPGEPLVDHEAGSGCGSAFADAVLLDHPLAYFPMDDLAGTTMFDLVPSSVNGSYGSAVALGQAGLAPSEPEASPHFAGGPFADNKIASVPQTSALEPGAAFSVELLFEEDIPNPGATDGGNDGFIDLVACEWGTQITPTNTVKVYLPLLENGTVTYPQPAGATVLVSHHIYQLDATYDGATVTLYLNGVVEATLTGSGTLDFSQLGANGLTIGGNSLATYRHILTGQIAQLSLYGTALSQARIQAHFHASGLDGSARCRDR